MWFNPVYSVLVYALRRLLGRVQMDHPTLEVRVFRDKAFEVLAHATVDAVRRDTTAVFWIRFTLPLETSAAPTMDSFRRSLPMCAGLPGFREKYWCIHRESNEYLGLYEWSPWERARDYSRSYAVRRARRQALTHTVHYGVIQRFSLQNLMQEEDLISFNPYRTTA